MQRSLGELNHSLVRCYLFPTHSAIVLRKHSAVSSQQSAVSHQPSAISRQPSAVAHKLFA
ncbi:MULTISPECIES: hypothetical protein [Moorena]|uniref:hypothetical protein n=1 Tax=Moorena TaxID=1155738 RepID=UPI0002E4DB20|nr:MULTISPECIES: hypothetical protein [Moorena]NEP68653.1 hypothetical protein [Moorena sp. SIO3A5]NER90429.1 hypothetical protein [Moorena sp. SIO3A2]NET68547.1 hypothetical protein [Moorena sp. SIO1G6]